MELFHAAQQWSIRPEDERFNTLEDLHAATLKYRQTAVDAVIPWREIRVEADGPEVVVYGSRRQARFTHYAFGQMCARVGAPAGFLRELPPTIVAQNLNYLLKQKTDASDANLLFHENGGGLLLRASLTDKYQRVWNHEVAERLIEFSGRHRLVPAQATFDWSRGGVGTQSGALDPNARKALYASDHDMFCFIMDPDRVIQGPSGPMRRGLIAINSEVGAKSLILMGFLFVDVCQNHIIWGAEQITEVKFRHVGEIAKNWTRAMVEVRRYLDGAASLQEADFETTLTQIAGTREEVLDRLFGIRKLGIPMQTLKAGYDAVVPAEDGDPRTVWGMAQGLTRVSQQEKYAEDRHSIDRAAGKLLRIAF